MSRRKREIDRMLARYAGYDREDWGGGDGMLAEIEKMTSMEAAYFALNLDWHEGTEAIEAEV